MVGFIINALTNLLRIVLIDCFITSFLGKAELGRRRKLIVGLCFYIVNLTLYWIFHTAWINVLSNLAGISAMVYLYTKSVRTNLFVTGSIYLINCGCDVAATEFFAIYKDGEPLSQVYTLISFFLFFTCELITEKMITARKNAEDAQSFPMILIPLCSILLLCVLVYTNVCTDTGIAIIGVGLLFLNFLMLYLYNMLLNSISEKYENEMLRQRVGIYANQLDIILQNDEKIRSLRHDMKHHINEIRLMAKRCQASEIEEYVDSMEEFISNPKEIVSSGNVEIDSVLNYMLQRAREELNTVDVSISLPEAMKHSFDFNVVLGNLLENAIEASGQTEQKYLCVQVSHMKGILKIFIENSYHETDVILDGLNAGGMRFLTTKNQKDLHGYGLKNVQQIIDKFNGTMEFSQKDGVFGVRLLLYLPE